MTAEEVATYVATQHLPDVSITQRQHQLLHWTGEALAISTDCSHRQILNLLRSPQFQPDSRWIAKQIEISVDQVNVALSRLLRLGFLRLGPNGKWKSLQGAGHCTDVEFKKRALIRVRELAVANGVDLRSRSTKSAN